jgi:putative membrane protein
MLSKKMTALGALAAVAGVCTLTQAASMSGGSSHPSGTDRRFMTTLAQGSMAEVKLGKLALQKSQTAQVRQVATTIVQDHTQANAALMQVATREGVRLPKDTDPAHKAAFRKLSGLSGAAFDKAYIANQVNDHDKTVGLINHEEESTNNGPLKAFLAVTYPKIQMHTKMLHQIQAGMMNGTKGGMKTGMSTPAGM